MFETDFELLAPNIPAITAATISSMPKPPTISETIYRLHQNLNSSAEKPKEKKRKKKSIECAIPAHLEHHLYAKPNPCVSSCTQPNTNLANYGYFAQFSGNDSKLFSESFQSKQSSNCGLNYGFHSSNYMSSQTPTQTTSQTSLPNIKPFQNGRTPNETAANSKMSAPPNIKPYYEYNCEPYLQPPLLKPPELEQTTMQSNNYGIESQTNDKSLMNNRFNGDNKVTTSLQLSDRMVEASTSTDDLGGVSSVELPFNPSANTNRANNVSFRVFKLYKIV